MSSLPPTPGILYVQSNPLPPLSDGHFNKWYKVHLEHVIDSGLADLAIRYKNTNPSSRYQYLAIYRLQDISRMSDTDLLATIPQMHELLPDGKGWPEALDVESRVYSLLQRFEGVGDAKEPRGQYLRTIMMEPAEGGDAELDEWYRKQHLDMLSMCAGYLRCTRFVLAPTGPAGVPQDGKEMSLYLACHEYESTNLPKDQIKIVTGTEWSKKVIGNAKKFEGEIWEAIKGGICGKNERL